MPMPAWIILALLSFAPGCTNWQDQVLQLSQVTTPGTRTQYIRVHRGNLKAQRIRCQVPVDPTDDKVYATDDPDWVEASQAMLAKIDKGCAKRILEHAK